MLNDNDTPNDHKDNENEGDDIDEEHDIRSIDRKQMLKSARSTIEDKISQREKDKATMSPQKLIERVGGMQNVAIFGGLSVVTGILLTLLLA